MRRLRVLVVEDSLTMRHFLCEAVAADPSCELVGEADNGKRAIELCQELRPDVISLDMMLPVMSGLAATEFIMAYVPTPILIVSASTNRGELFKTYEALSAGAVDAIEKPRADEDGATWSAHYTAQLRLVARVRVLTHVRGRLQTADSAPRARVAPSTARAGGALRPLAAAIGASTGGPRAIVQVLHGIPPGLGVPLLLVIHIGESFGSAFADWLDGQTRHRVRLARDGEALDPEVICVAPPGRHLRLRGRRLACEDGPERHSCKPSVDELFESLARECGAACAAALLTGMGTDGAIGLAAIRAAGGTTIAQDEASSVVYGMPREAARLDAAQRILPLDAIGPALASALDQRGVAP